MVTDLKLSELMNSRFCHDLAGPIGAISNGVEFLDENDEGMQDKAKSLIAESVEQAIARLQFFRQAYGSVAEEGEANLGILKQYTENYFKNSRVKLDWKLTNSNLVLSHREAKLILNFIIIASGVLIKGGTINITTERKQNLVIKVVAAGEYIKFDAENQNLLLNDVLTMELDSKVIQLYYTKKLLDDIKGRLSIIKEVNEFILQVEVDK